MDPSETLTAKRAKPSDADAITDFVARATRGRVSVDSASVLQRFGTKGLWLVRDANQEVVGLSGWRAENLIARIDDFLIFPFELYESAGKALLDGMENAAQELQCEVSILLVPLRASPRVVEFYQSCGYRRAQLEGLPRVWQETAREATARNRYIMLKRLREDLVTRPM